MKQQFVIDQIAAQGGHVIPPEFDATAMIPFGGLIKGVKALRALRRAPKAARGGKADPEGVGLMEMFKIADDATSVAEAVAERVRRLALKNKLPIMALATADQVKKREPHPSELAFFKDNPHVGGMAAEDDAVIINPYSKLSEKEKAAVTANETARVLMRRPGMSPNFELTPEQQGAFANYGAPADQRATVAARILSGDPSALAPTPDQEQFVGRLRSAMEGNGMFPVAGGMGPEVSPYIQAAIQGAGNLGQQLQQQGQPPMPGQQPAPPPSPVESLGPYLQMLQKHRAAQLPQFQLGQPFQQPMQPQMVPGSLMWGMGPNG